MDFQVGDEVFCLLNGEGVVVEINNNSLYHQVIVKLTSGRLENYTQEGHYSICNKNPCLYHKGTVVTIKSAQPKRERYKWVNIYSDNNGNCLLGTTYNSEANARDSIGCIVPGYKYVDTIQIKPKGEN
jgi:hypothetical protein